VPDGRLVADERAQPLDALGVEAVGRLVQDEDLGVAEQGGGQLQALAHPEGELADPASGHVGQAHQVERLAHPGHGDAGPQGHGLQVVLGAAGGVEAGGFEHRADVVDGVVQLHVPAAAERGRPVGDGHQAEEHAKGGGLARAVGPEEARDPARRHLEAEVIDSPEGPELLAEPLDLDG
jgi:hypothetical protein